MNNRQIVGLFVILLGLSFLFDLPFFNIVISLLIIYIGVKVMTGNTTKLPLMNNIETHSSEDYIKRVLVFTGMKTTNDSKNFRGAEIVTVFGEGKIDLSKVSTREEQLEINLVAVFGLIKLIVPKEWDVKTEGVGIIGAITNNTSKPSKQNVSVAIEGAAIFGGIDISS